MSTAWERIMEEARRHAKGREQQWLVERLSDVSDQPYTIQRVQNWKARGIPKGEYPTIALALGKSIDWVAGMEFTERATPVPMSTAQHLEVLTNLLALTPERQVELAEQIHLEAAQARKPGRLADPMTYTKLGRARKPIAGRKRA